MSGWHVAVDLGGTNFKAASFAPDGHKRRELREPVEKHDGRALVAQLGDAIRRLREDAGVDGFEAIGMCVPGNVDRGTQRVVASPNFPLLVEFDVASAVAAATGLPLTFDNDANAAALGEWRFGVPAGRAGIVIYISLGTGVGGGVVIDGETLQGQSGFAGELGHVVVEPDGDACGCGGWGCVEQVASAGAIVRAARRLRRDYPGSSHVERVHPHLSARDVGIGARAGDPLCVEALARAGRGLGIAVAGFINIFNPTWVVLGGGVSGSGPPLLEPMIEETRRRAFRRPFDECEIGISPLGEDVGLYGAYALVQSGVDGGADGGVLR